MINDKDMRVMKKTFAIHSAMAQCVGYSMCDYRTAAFKSNHKPKIGFFLSPQTHRRNRSMLQGDRRSFNISASQFTLLLRPIWWEKSIAGYVFVACCAPHMAQQTPVLTRFPNRVGLNAGTLVYHSTTAELTQADCYRASTTTSNQYTFCKQCNTFFSFNFPFAWAFLFRWTISSNVT